MKKMHAWLYGVKIAEKLHVYKRRKKDGEACSYCGGGPMWMMGNAIMHENKENQVKIRVSVEREELDRLMKDMDNDSCIHCEKEVIDND